MSSADSELRVRPAEAELRLGVVDCLSAGFGQVNRMLWVVLLPVLLALFLWQGPQLSAAPAFARAVNWYTQMMPADTPDVPSGASFSGNLHELMESVPADGNLFSFLTVGAGIAGRGSMPAVPIAVASSGWTLPPVEQPSQALGVAILMFALGLLLGVAYLGLIAQRVRGERCDPMRLALRIWGYWWGVVGFLLVLAIAALAVAVPVAFTLGLALAFASAAAAMILMVVVAIWQIAAIWLAIFSFFVVDAVVLAELGPLRALRSSIAVVARNFWSSVGFIALYLLISYGMLALWSFLGGSPLATVVSILGQAYIGTGLAAGSMIYYRTRAASLARVSLVKA